MSGLTKTAQVLTVLDEIQPANRQDLIDTCVRVLGTTPAGAKKMIDRHVAEGRILKAWGREPRSVVYSLPKLEGARAARRPTSDELIERTRPSASEADELRAAVAGEILAHMAEAEEVPNDGAGWSAGSIASELQQETRQVALAIAGLVKAGKLQRHTAPSGFYAYCLPTQVTTRAISAPAGQAVSVRADAAKPASEQPPQRGPDNASSSGPVTAQPDDEAQASLDQAERARKWLQEQVGQINFADPLSEVRAAIEGSLRDVDDLLGEVLEAEAPHAVARSVLAAQISLRHALAGVG